MIYMPYGDSAMLVNFEQKIDETVNQNVTALYNALEVSGLKGIAFLIPAYCSITIGFDKSITTFEELKSTIASFAKEEMSHLPISPGRLVHIPVSYEAPFDLDMEEVISHTGLCKDTIVKLHTSTIFRVYMLGFVAGFAYMGTLPEMLKSPRKAEPQLKVPEGSVGLAGLQTGIYPSEAPGGWQIIGRTPLKMFDHNKSSPSLLQPGDRVQFKAIDESEFDAIEKLQSVAEYELEVTSG